MRGDLLGRGPGRRSDPRGGGGLSGDHSGGGRAAAFFDLDRTLLAGSAAIEFARAAYRAGLIGRRQLAADGLANLRFRLRGSTDESAAELRDRVARVLEGVRVADAMRQGPEILVRLLPRIYPRMLEVAYEHQDAGRPIYICTAASQEIAELLAHVLVFDGGIGSRSEIRDGVYTGRFQGAFTYREGKATAIRELAGKEGLDLAASWAYSDSESDLPMLRVVGSPVAVNPDAELARIAREEGWEVMRFETLGRRLKLSGALLTALLVGGVGSAVASRRRPPSGRPAGRLRRSSG